MTNKIERLKIVKAERPGGFLDFLTPEFLAREKMLKIIEKVFRSHGFDPVETPMIEFEEILSGETSDTGKNIFLVKSRFDSSEGKQLALRFDQTVPFARLLAANPFNSKMRTGIKLPWRRMVVGPVFRGESPQSGRYRQFYQFDADIAGTFSMVADAEIIAMMFYVLRKLNVDRFQIHINNRKILNGLGELVGIKGRKNVDKYTVIKEMMRILDKIDKIGLESVVIELRRHPHNDFDPTPCLSAEGIAKIKSFLSMQGDNFEKIKQCKNIFAGIKVAQEGIKELEIILDYIFAMEIQSEVIQINFSIARGLDYYTGPVMETVLLDASQFGSVFSGGRYNDLVGRFTGKELPSVGASIGVDRLFAALKFLNKIDLSKQTVVDAMVLRLMENEDIEYLRIAQEIRKFGINCEICLLDNVSFKAQFNFAISRGVKYVVIYGEDEKRKGLIQIKNLENREQNCLLRKELKNFFECIDKNQ